MRACLGSMRIHSSKKRNNGDTYWDFWQGFGRVLGWLDIMGNIVISANENWCTTSPAGSPVSIWLCLVGTHVGILISP